MSRLKVTLVHSGISRPETQQRTLEGLGLRKLRQSVVCGNTPSIRGMIKKVIHLVSVEEVCDEPAGS